MNLQEWKKERLKRNEELLRQSGLDKCNICKQFMDKEYINKGICKDCERR